VCRPRRVTGGTPELPRIASTKYATRAAATWCVALPAGCA
jgi:hypothetical protein